MAGGNTAGCKGGRGASNWGWMSVSACLFTPSFSYKLMACIGKQMADALLAYWHKGNNAI